MAATTCEQCGEGLGLVARADARYCAARCRQRARRARQRIPVQLTSRPQWVRRSARKVPLTATGTLASATDPATWTTHKAARRSTAGDGLGFVLSPTDPIICIDLDHCLTSAGDLAPWAARILDRAPETWVEISPSGDGLHIWGIADFLGGRRLPGQGGTIEIYGSGRYITVTGRRYRGAPAQLAALDDLLAELI